MNFTTISLPAWAVSDEAKAWFYGFVSMALVRVFRAGLRWFKGSSRSTDY
jgi:hypothetical protein